MNPSSDHHRYCSVCAAVYSAETDFCPKDGSKLAQSERIIAGRYLLKGALGVGNMGAVHRAVQLPMGRQVAVKLLHPELVRNPEMVARFEREALAASAVDHPNAITIYDSGHTAEGDVYIAMEYLEGEPLSALLGRERLLPANRALELWVPIVKAMVVAHRKGVIHRDLKPDNIFVSHKASDSGASEEVVKVLDFGIAKLLQAMPTGALGRPNSKTLAGTSLGTALYMAPEQLEGREAGKHSDVYALGLVLIEMLSGRLPWGKSAAEADTVMTMLRLVTPAKPLRELCPGQPFSARLQQLFDDVLAIEPERRPQDAGELLKRVAQIPEAGFLASVSGRRSEVSQLFTAAFISAALRSEAAADADPTTVDGVPAASSGITDPAVAPLHALATELRPGAQLGPDPPTQPLELAKMSAPPAAKLGLAAMAMETVRTAVPGPLRESGTTELPVLPTVVKGQPPIERPTAAGPNPSLVRTMPSPPRAAPSDNLPATLPLALARLPPGKIKSVASRPESQPTVGMVSGPSSTTMQSPQQRVLRRRWLQLGLLGLLLLAIGYLLLRLASNGSSAASGSLAPVTEDRSSQPIASAASPAPSPSPADRAVTATASDPSSLRRPGLAPLAADPASPPPSPAVDPQGSPLHVSIRVRKPLGAVIACGGEPLRVCDGSCTVGAGESCLIRHAGYSAKRLPFDELDRRSHHGKLRVELFLTAE